VPGETADMHLVDDGLRKRPTERRIALPVIGARVDDHVPERRGRVVAGVSSCLPASAGRPSYAFPVRVEQHLVRVKTKAPDGIERSGDAIGIDLACGDARDECVPVVVGAIAPRVEIDDPRRLRGVHVVEQQ